jgi:hypothetical protein
MHFFSGVSTATEAPGKEKVKKNKVITKHATRENILIFFIILSPSICKYVS